MLVVTIQGSFEKARGAIRLAAKKADIIEFRLDLMEKMDLSSLSKLKGESTLPVIFTLRKSSHGGNFKGSETERERRLLEFLTLKPAFVDLEYDSSFFDKIDPEIQVISSYHNFQETPEDLELILRRMKRSSATFYKLATWAHSSLDALKMLLFVKNKQDVAGMCMGAQGAITRILAPVVKSPLTYTSLDEKGAPGQISMKDLVEIYHYPLLNESTEIYSLIGDPIDKSVGHLFHNAIFQKLKKNRVYVKILLKREELKNFFHLIKGLPFLGMSVTLPLKEAVIPYLNRVDPEAKKIGAINTLVNRRGEWFGTNTDGKGALEALEKKGKVWGKTILIIGAGGTGKAISQEASRRGARVMITNRTMRKAKRLAAQVGGMAISLSDIESCAYDIIINATTVGMSPTVGEMPVFHELIKENVIGFDVVIHPKETTFLSAVKNKGGQVVYGIEMYVQQAFAQLNAWLIYD